MNENNNDNDRIQFIKNRLIKLETEKKELINELYKLKQKVIIKLYGTVVRQKVPESKSDKIKLFEELFVSRNDVFPKFWENKKKGTKGFSPVCNNEWKYGICSKPKIKCSECLHRDFQILDSKIIESHLTGLLTIGMYALKPDDTCIFLAADFDKSEWETDVISYKEAGEKMGVPVYIEKSRSGNGAHAWIFFSESIPAYKARHLGTIILTQAAKENFNISLQSYDRFFPNQDYMPKGGYGNLIAMPLQMEPRKCGNTVFVDNNITPYKAQWQFLAEILRLSKQDVDEIIATNSNTVKEFNLYESEDLRINEAETGLNINQDELIDCYPEKIILHLGSMINLDISKLPVKLIFIIKRIATFANPVFFIKQKMRFSTWNIPKYISCVELIENVLRIPRALLDYCEDILQQAGAKIIIEDKRNSLENIDIRFTGKLKSTQKTAVTKLLNFNYSVLNAPTGTGKTIIAINIICKRNKPTLILVHRKQILDQWKKQIIQFTDIDKNKIGIIGSGKNLVTGIIDIAMLQTLSKRDNINELKNLYEQIIVDECHHIPAPSFDAVISKFPVRYTLGLTATPIRKDGHHPILHMLIGPIKYTYSENPDDSIKRITFFKETTFKISNEYGERPPIHEVWNNIIEDEKRNNLITSDIINVIKNKRIPLVLSERKDHLEFISESLKRNSNNEIEICIFTGDIGKKLRKKNFVIIENYISENKPFCILSIGSLIGEGFDLPELDTLFLTMPISFKGRVIQYAGRLHRKHNKKNEVHIYDYVDTTLGLTISMFKKRVAAYRNMRYELFSPQGSKIERWL